MRKESGRFAICSKLLLAESRGQANPHLCLCVDFVSHVISARDLTDPDLRVRLTVDLFTNGEVRQQLFQLRQHFGRRVSRKYADVFASFRNREPTLNLYISLFLPLVDRSENKVLRRRFENQQIAIVDSSTYFSIEDLAPVGFYICISSARKQGQV